MSSESKPPTRLSTIRQASWRILRVIGGAYALVLLGLVLFETRLVYPGAYTPIHTPLRPPQVANDSSKEVVAFDYTSADSVQLSGRLLRKPLASRFVVYFHGNGRRASEMDDELRYLSESLDATVLMAEYRGFQENTGSPNEASVLADGLAATEAFCDQLELPADQVVLYGRSLGGGVAVAVAKEKGCQCLLLDRTFCCMVDVAERKYPIFPVRFLMRNRYDSGTRIAAYQGPLFQIHGDADRLIPIAQGRLLHEHCPSQDKEFFAVPTLGHNDPLPTSVQQAMLTFLDTHTSPSEKE